jgi:hypothetical protein
MANGVRYTGRDYIWYNVQYETFFGAGSSVMIYFRNADPTVSYALRPLNSTLLVIYAVIFSAAGIIVLFQFEALKMPFTRREL